MFQIGHIRFLDSFQFLSTSLEQLVCLLRKSEKQHNFVHTAKHMNADDKDTFAKEIFPYSFASWLAETSSQETQLPPIEAFHDELKDEPRDKKDYECTQTIQDYRDHYLLMTFCCSQTSLKISAALSWNAISWTVCTLSLCLLSHWHGTET